MVMDIRKVYEKYCDGDRLTNAELDHAVITFKQAFEALLQLGACFKVTRKECGRMMFALEDMQRARANKEN